jgi:hypothetical protein
MGIVKQGWDSLFGPKAVTQEFSAETLDALRSAIVNNPAAGLGNLTQWELLKDAIIAQHNIVMAQYRKITPKRPKPPVPDDSQETFDLQVPLTPTPSDVQKQAYAAAQLNALRESARKGPPLAPEVVKAAQKVGT